MISMEIDLKSLNEKGIRHDIQKVSDLGFKFTLLCTEVAITPEENAQFTAWAKAQKDPVAWGSAGPGSPHHLVGELFRERSGLKMQHIAYKGAAPAVQDVVAGQVPFMFVDTASGQQFIANGKLRAIGIASPKRVKNFETIPTLSEQGLKGFEAYAWQGLVMPAGTPADIVGKVNAALLQALDTTAVKARLQVLGLEATPSNPAQMADFAAKERTKWGAVIRASGIKVD